MEEEIDLFENYHLLPQEVRNILDTFDGNKDPYIECKRVIKELEKVGYTANYYLDGILYDLKKL